MKRLILLLVINIIFAQHIDCVGSSITRNGYPGYTNQLMVNNSYVWRVHNYGIPGAGIVQNAYKDKPEYEEVICREAEIVVLLLGVNDWEWYSTANQSAKDNWESEYRNLVKEFKKFSTVVLGYLIHRVNVGSDVTLANATIDKMNIIITKIASDYALSIIDFKSAIGTNPSHFWPSDGLHPNSLGSELLGLAAYKHLKNLTSTGRNVKDCTADDEPIPDDVPEPEAITFSWKQIGEKVLFQWTPVDGASYHRLSKSWMINGVLNYWCKEFRDGENEYYDTDFIIDQTYYMRVKAYKSGNLIGQSLDQSMRYTEYLGLDEEYWDTVEYYDNQKKIGWFGCQKN